MKLRHMFARPLGILALGLVLLGGAFFFTPAQAHAASLREEINALKATIEDLRASLGASVYKSTAATSATVSTPAPAVVSANVSAATVTSLKLGSKSDDVKKLQEKLFNLGYYKGAFDGSYGKGTADAVRAYQLAKGLAVDGSAGSDTLRFLGITLSSSTAASAKPTTTPTVSVKPYTSPVKPISVSSLKDGVLGQVSMWYGKVNQHRPTGGSWTTDADGTAGAGNYSQWGSDGWGDRKLQYCQRFWPETVAVEAAGEQSISGWRGRGNIGNSVSTKPVYNCLGDSEEENDDEVVTSQCNESDVEVSITGNTPEGIQPISQFNVLEFTIENNSDCDILFEDVKVAYMTTDGKPYFDEIQIRGENGAFLGENDELQTDPYFDLGDRITIALNGVEGLEIDAGDHVDLMLRLVNYDQPVFDNSVPYNSFRHKYLMFGFINEDDFDFKWGSINNSPSFGATYTNNDLWGKKVRIPPSSL